VVVLDAPALKEAIQAIRRLVCEHFFLREMRDPELTLRTNRRAYVLPRQIAMYIARQLTGASLEEIGREFGGRHHTTVLHSVNKDRADAPRRRRVEPHDHATAERVCLGYLMLRHQRLLQFRVFRLGLLQDWNVGVGVFPENEEVLVGGSVFVGVIRWHLDAGTVEV
jgi:hypothetical protein